MHTLMKFQLALYKYYKLAPRMYDLRVGAQLCMLNIEADSLVSTLMVDERTILFAISASYPLCTCNTSAIVNVTFHQTKYLSMILPFYSPISNFQNIMHKRLRYFFLLTCHKRSSVR